MNKLDILRYISNNNFIKIYKNYIDNYIKKNKIEDIYNKILYYLKNTNTDYRYIYKYEWKVINHEYPYIYKYYNENISKISYNDFKIKMYKNELDININYDKYYSNIEDKAIKEILIFCQKAYFISLEIKLYIENNINSCYIYKTENANIYFFSSNKIEINKRIELINNIVIIIEWLYKIRSKNKLNFYYFDTPLKKEITNYKNIKLLSCNNINSGLSYMNNIIIWRREELTKVLIHELIHFLNIDKKNNNIYHEQVGEINYPVLINESITELLAQFIHSIYISYILNKEYKKFIDIYHNELIYNWYQLSKIFNYYEIYEFNSKLIKLKFNQSSNAYSYYIIKCLISFKYYDIINIIFDKSNKYKESIKYQLNNIPYEFINKIISSLIPKDNYLNMIIYHSL
jgi:hypothetical protein